MKQVLLPLGVGALLLGAAACSHKAPVKASTPPAPTPVVETPAPTKELATRPAPQQAAAKPTPPPTQTRGDRPTAKEIATLNESLARLVDALFDYDKSTIRTDASVVLKDDVNVIREILTNYPNQKLIIEGHADERGSVEYNQALGDRRAHTVEEFLTSMGIPQAQLTMISFGKERPVCTDQTEECWQRNRRAHVTAAP